MPKKNGFLMYIESRKPSLLAGGRSVTGNLKELVDICDPGWRELSQEEKKRFSDEAKSFNERVKKIKVAANPAASKQPVPVSVFMEPKEKDFGRAIVCKMFENKEWRSQPIVVCSFSLYVDPGLQDMYLPAEIGLSAFSLQNGVLDNYARIIDPGDVPRGYGIEAFHNAQKLGVPEPGTVPDFANYEPILMIVESFLQKYKVILHGGDNLYVFVFDSDYIMIAQCLEWLFNKTGYRLPIKILSLTLWCFLASTYGPRAASNSRTDTQTGNFFRQNENVMAVVSRHRVVGQPLIGNIGNFIYSTNHPMAAFGIFVHEEDVEGVIKEVDNYKYFEELCCIYHVKNGVEIQNCALNTANRFAFSILEILTLSNDIPIVPGEHFPQIDHPAQEKRRRYNMLRKWGISICEEEMEIRQHAEVGPPTPPDRGFRNIERRREEFAERRRIEYAERRSRAPRAMAGRRPYDVDALEEDGEEQRERTRPFRQTFNRKSGGKFGGMSSGRRGQPVDEEMEEDEHQDQNDSTPPFKQVCNRKPSPRGNKYSDAHDATGHSSSRHYENCYAAAKMASFGEDDEEDQEEDEDSYPFGGLPRGMASRRRMDYSQRDCERKIDSYGEVPSIFRGPQKS